MNLSLRNFADNEKNDLPKTLKTRGRIHRRFTMRRENVMETTQKKNTANLICRESGDCRENVDLPPAW